MVEGNILDTESFTLHGAQHVMYRNNISLTNGYPAYNIQGYNSIYKRRSSMRRTSTTPGSTRAPTA